LVSLVNDLQKCGKIPLDVLKYGTGLEQLNLGKCSKTFLWKVIGLPTLPQLPQAGVLANPADMHLLLNDLRGHDPNKLMEQYLEQFAHIDFVMGVCARDYIYKDVIAFINRYKVVPARD
jgi:hypothetical protein